MAEDRIQTDKAPTSNAPVTSQTLSFSGTKAENEDKKKLEKKAKKYGKIY